MTLKEAYLKEEIWHRKIIIVSLYHNAQLLKMGSQNLIETAKYFEISIGLVSENLMLNKHYEEIKDCKSRNEGLQKLRGKTKNDNITEDNQNV